MGILDHKKAIGIAAALSSGALVLTGVFNRQDSDPSNIDQSSLVDLQPIPKQEVSKPEIFDLSDEEAIISIVSRETFEQILPDLVSRPDIIDVVRMMAESIGTSGAKIDTEAFIDHIKGLASGNLDLEYARSFYRKGLDISNDPEF